MIAREIAKSTAYCAVMTGLLIAVQYALFFVNGVELVTVMLLAWSYRTGPVRASAVAISFSLIRCLFFGFFPAVVVLYLIYYTAFAIFFGFAGIVNKQRNGAVSCIVISILAAVFTATFTILDDVISPLILQMNSEATTAYFYASLPVMGTQCAFALLSCIVLFPVLSSLFKRIILLKSIKDKPEQEKEADSK